MRPRLRQLLACATFGLALSAQTPAALAFETRVDAPEDLIQRIESASLVFTAKAEGITEPQDILAMANADYRRILSVLYDLGHFGPTIDIRLNGQEVASFPPFQPLKQVTSVEYRVDPGPKFAFGTTRIAPLAPATELPEGFATGETANTAAIRGAAQAGVDAWRAAGHAKARVTRQDIRANHRNATLSADLRLSPGQKLSFGNLTLSGESAVSERRLRKIISLPTGETFDPDELDRISKRLRRTGIFRSVAITESETVSPQDEIDIDVALQDNKPRRIGFGAEFESRDGISVSAYWLHRNLLGGGERLRVEGEVSGIGAQTGGTDYLFDSELIRPATLGADTDLSFRLTAERINDPLFILESVSTRIGFNRLVSDKLTVYAGLQLETNDVTDDFGNRSFQFLGLPLVVTYDGRDDELDTTSGLYSRVILMPYLGYSGTESGTYLLSDTRAYRSLGDRVVAAGRFQLGAVFGPDLANTPPDLLFLSGGGGTVRGQPFQSNFITTGGNDSGGLSFLGFSGEMRVRTTRNISAVAFYDAGFIGESTNFTSGGEWHSGAGVGIRYHTGIGPIRVDIAGPVSGSNSGGVQLYIGIGQAF